MNKKQQVIIIVLLLIAIIMTGIYGVVSRKASNPNKEPNTQQKEGQTENEVDIDNASDLSQSAFISDDFLIEIVGDDVHIVRNDERIQPVYKLHYSGGDKYLIIDKDELIGTDNYVEIETLFPGGLSFVLNDSEMSIELFQGSESLGELEHYEIVL